MRGPGLCEVVRWCDEVAGHGGDHRAYLGDFQAAEMDAGRGVIVQVTLEGDAGEAIPVVNVVTGRLALRLLMPPPEASGLAAALTRALSRSRSAS